MSRLDKARVIRTFVIGGFAGFVNFVIQEPRARAVEIAGTKGSWAGTIGIVFAEAVLMFAILGMLISVAIVLADEFGLLSARRVLTRCGIALVSGLVCGAFAGLIGQAVFSLLLGPGIDGLMTVILARTVGWAAVGGGIGLAAGIPSASLRKCFQGFIGGLIGGAVVGFVFDPVSIPSSSGTISRFIGDVAIGACVGAAVAFVEESAKIAWVTIVLGRNEGKQYILSKPTTSIGRDELSDIPLYGDMTVAKQHATIRTSDWRTFIFQDLGSPTGSAVNGVRVIEKPLIDGDRIQIGGFQLLFNHRSGAQVVPQPDCSSQASRSYQQVWDQSACPFCGGPRDPATGACPCTPSVGITSVAVGEAPSLVGIAGPYTSLEFRLDRDYVDIGRDPSNAVVLDRDPSVSRKHAAIVKRGSSYLVQDLGSTNGTYVNGVRVQSVFLNPGDVVHFGNSSFRFAS
ncbi:MAG: FHA domain-containing protein [Armatimonadetes bacterium]|nr:FHA domain-containing protein [Armatimonadota bacterium]